MTAVAVLVLLIYISAVCYVRYRPLPEGLNYCGPVRRLRDEDLSFCYDMTWWEDGERHFEEKLYQEIFTMVSRAQRFILIDMFLFNLDTIHEDVHPPVSRELAGLLIMKKKLCPGIRIYFITDPINGFYGNYTSEPLARLEAAGIPVIVTRIRRLRDCNHFYGALWLLLFSWMGTGRHGWMPHPLRNRQHHVTIRAALEGACARANHRKVVVVDEGNHYTAMVTSANVHEASNWFPNTGFKVRGPFVYDVVNSESKVSRFSGGGDIQPPADMPKETETDDGEIEARLLTEKAFKDVLLTDLAAAGQATSIRVAMLFVSDEKIIKALVDAAGRGADIELVLDNNLRSFGQKKMGLPNHVNAYRLMRRSRGSIRVKFWNSKREQLHSKLVMIEDSGTVILYGGSSNLTLRNAEGFTLESNLRICAPSHTKIAGHVRQYFERIREPKFSHDVACRMTPELAFKWGVYSLQNLVAFTTY